MAEYDSSNQRHISLAKRQAKADEDADTVFINTAMGMVNGRAYIHRLLVRCHVFAQPFDADSHVTAFGCGELNVGQWLLADIMRCCPDAYVTMMREANARDIAADNRRSRSNEDANGRDSEPDVYVHPGDDSPPAADSDEDRGFGRERTE